MEKGPIQIQKATFFEVLGGWGASQNLQNLPNPNYSLENYPLLCLPEKLKLPLESYFLLWTPDAFALITLNRVRGRQD